MQTNRWQEVSSVLDEVLTIDESEQITYLEEKYGEDEKLVDEVKEFLHSIQESEKTSFLESARDDNESLLKDLNPSAISERLTSGDLVGSTVGPYKITELLGKGGMGSVYKAVRNDGQFDQTVAIKFINIQNASELARNRFKQEQKILANLQHSNIAMLLDGGVIENGLPYLIIEYVEGTRIDSYCNKKKLSLSDRLALIKKILDAIEYAHSNLVIHRDLKPNNILVTESGDVKILDFGIAKLLDEDGDINELLTRTGQRLWTPQYAAPEQVLEKPAQLQTDIYALGMLMYKILGGSQPYQFKEKSIHQVERAILEENPPLMSRRVQKVDNDKVLTNFGIKKRVLTKELSNDLDAIVAKAIRKEPEYRYSSVSLLLEDLMNFEKDIPVMARRGNLTYRAKKYIKRNRQPILFAALLLMVISGLVFYYTAQVNEQRVVAERQAANSQQMTEFLVGIFESANPHHHDGMEAGLSAPIGDVLETNIDRMDEELEGQPLLRGSLKTTLGKMYLRLGEFDRAEVLTTDAIESLSLLDMDTREELASALYELGRVHQERGNTEMADSLLLEAIEIHERTELGLADEQALAAVSMYANLQWFNHGDFDTADSLLSQNLEIRYQHYGDDPGNLAVGHNDLAAMNHGRGSFSDASNHYRQAIDLYREALGDHPSKAVVMGNYSQLLKEYNRLDEAREMQQNSLDIHIESSGERTIDTGLGYGNLADINLLEGNLEAADSLVTRSIDILTEIYGDVHPFVGRNKLIRANILMEQGHLTEAENLSKTLIDEYQQLYPPTHGRQSDPQLTTGKIYLRMDNPEVAKQYLVEALEIRKEGYSKESWRTAVAMKTLSEALIMLDETERAEELLSKSIEILRSEFGEDDFRFVKANELKGSL